MAGRLVGEQFIEAGALDLKGRAHSGRKFILKVKFGMPVPVNKGRAVFELKTRVDDSIQHACLLDKFHALRQQAFADTEPGKLLAFDNGGLVTQVR